MPELKHNFLKGRMNKDLDERLVPNGEYRDALNIEVSTSEDSNVGAVQTVMGNTKLSSIEVMHSTKCVGKILDEKNDKLYWFISEAGNQPSPYGENPPTIYGDFTITDLIMEVDVTNNEVRPIVVDTFYTAVNITGHDLTGSGRWISVESINWDSTMPYVIYPGMEISCIDNRGQKAFPQGTIVVNVDLVQKRVQLSNKPNDPADLNVNYANYQVKFENFNRALNFQNRAFKNQSSIITGINIIDDLLFWTDNFSEPKKVNISKCKKERTLNPYTQDASDMQAQSMLVVSDIGGIPNALKLAIGNSPWSETALVPLKEKHITVIKKSPVKSLNLVMRNSPREGNLSGTLNYVQPSGACIDTGSGCNSMSFYFGLNNTQTITTAIPAPAPFNPFWDYQTAKLKESAWVNFGGPNSKINQKPLQSEFGWAAEAPLYEIGDVIIFTVVSGTSIEETIRAKVTNRDRLFGGYEVSILSASEGITAIDYVYNSTLEQADPMFEFKFPRFSYRYKYEDGEYSAFAPFSEIAFLPEKFEYLPKKGYNLGMTNNLRKLVIKDFVDNKLLPKDVLSIDILYKESNSPNIYTVKTITKDDFEWNAISENTLAPNNNNNYIGTRGCLKIESEMIHAILPSNQLLRPWDNVPREALSQEITKNRLVYGNYLQNYNMRDVNNSHINVSLELTAISRAVGEDVYGSFHYTPEQRDPKNALRYDPSKSIKTLRTYQLGIVYRDKYGRETPVFSTDVKQSSSDVSKASIYLEKKFSNAQSKLKAQTKNNPPVWAESFKFFIKETSNEYYNLAMDRWYDAKDENVWLSFPSSERNKVDIDTFLILKKEKDGNDFISEPARYKILAIENEAPTFIKTTEHNFGKISDGNNEGIGLKTVFRTDNGTSSTGFPKQNASYMYVAADKFGSDNHSSGLGWHKSILQEGKGNLYMRMRTAGVTSNWYKITSISLEQGVGANNTDYYRIDIEKGIFGEDMNITCTDPNNINDNNISAGLALEIKQNIIEHRPEFEGRFFVKIYKDQLIIDKLIKPDLENIEYTVQEAKAIGYVNDSDGNRGSKWPTNSTSTKTHTSLGIETWAPTHWTGSNQYIGNGTKHDKIRFGNNSSSSNYWSSFEGWFIDQASAWRPIDAWRGGGTCGNKHRVDAKYITLHNRKARNYYGKGIYNGGRDMHLSYSNIGPAKQSGSGFKRGIHQYTSYADDVHFLNKLIAAGTLFRWKEDPDQHIYVTVATHRLHGGSDGGMPFGAQYYNYYQWDIDPHKAPVVTNHCKNHAMRNRFHIAFRRLIDSKPMGDYDTDKHNARYTPVNDPSLPTWFDSDGINLAEKGTCSDTNFNNNQQGCLDESGTWTYASDSFYDSNGTWKSTAPTTPAPGIRQDMHGGPGPKTIDDGDPLNQPGRVTLEILETIVRGANIENASTNPAIWETEPKEDVGLDIYHEVGQVYYTEINNKTNEHFAPIGSTVSCYRPGVGSIVLGGSIAQSGVSTWVPPIKVKSWNDNIVTLEDSATQSHFNALQQLTPPEIRTTTAFNNSPAWPNEHAVVGDVLIFTRADGSTTEAKLDNAQANSPEYTMNREIHNSVATLPWFNCYSFGNGVESDRVRDDFNQVTIDNGPKASTTLDEPYLEERRGSGLIYSGIYNSISGINNLNQFIQAEKITKDLNPTYGSIQKLHSRDTDLVTLCEDKILKVQANKDALFNADGNTNVTATSNVLGQTIPFSGEFGISKNPESFVSESFRAYFTDKQRGVVLRLSQDGLTPISEVGMKDWFADNLRISKELIGSYDDKKSTYNLTLISDDPTTISFSERAKGWTSFKSFIPETGESLNNKYYTFKQGDIWEHHNDLVHRNSFYDKSGIRNYESSVTVLFNDDPGSVKSFTTLNYEGTKARITSSLLDKEYYNDLLVGGIAMSLPFALRVGIDNLPLAQFGWYVDNIKTDLQQTEELEFKAKENKWFSTIQGVTTELSNVDTKEFSVQGIGNASNITTPAVTYGCINPEAMNYSPNAQVDDGSCTYCVYGCMIGSDNLGSQVNSNYNPLATCDDGSCAPCVYGCTDQGNSNYNGLATCDDGSCIQCIYGCMNAEACNYNPIATCDDGTCTTTYGCMDSSACNYNSLADCDDGSCLTIYGCMDSTTIDGCGIGCNGALNYNAKAECTEPGSCIYCVYGCMDIEATNYSHLATCNAAGEAGGCTYPPPETALVVPVVSGCMDSSPGYNPDINGNDDSGNPCCWPCNGGYENANYNPAATIEDDSCAGTGPLTVSYNVGFMQTSSSSKVHCGNCGNKLRWVAFNPAYPNYIGGYSNTPSGTFTSITAFDMSQPIQIILHYMGEIESFTVTHHQGTLITGNQQLWEFVRQAPWFTPEWAAAISNLESTTGTTINEINTSSASFIHVGSAHTLTTSNDTSNITTFSSAGINISNLNLCNRIKLGDGSTRTISEAYNNWNGNGGTIKVLGNNVSSTTSTPHPNVSNWTVDDIYLPPDAYL